jgi:hypothetical protein
MLTALTSGGRTLLNLLQSQLSFFGAIDEAVLFAKEGHGENPDAVLRTVEAMLPHTTGFGQAGWYRELEDFANRPGVRVSPSPARFPSAQEALGYLQASTHDERMRLASDSLGPEPSGTPARLPERVGAYDPTHDPVLARSTYAAMVLAKIANLGGMPPGLPPDMHAQIVAPAINFWRGSPDQFDAGNPRSDPTVQNLLDQADSVHSRQHWHSLAAEEVDPKFADQSLPCFGTLVDVNGQYCSTIYTDATDDTLSVDDIEKIIDPTNWSLCCKFFCNVAAQAPPYTARGWSRILETIGPDCSEWCLKTALVFYYGSDSGSGSIFINYDLDPNRQSDSGLVEVDNGYIWITPTNGTDPSQSGVQIRTSKKERVQGLSPTATSALGCLLGWGDAAYELLGGTAKKILDGTISANLQPFQETPPAGYQSQTGSGGAHPPAAGARPTLPPNFADAVKDARDLLNNLINRTRDVTADAANRWMDGMTREDVKEITEGIGTNLEEFALDVYQTAENNVKPQVKKAN